MQSLFIDLCSTYASLDLFNLLRLVTREAFIQKHFDCFVYAYDNYHSIDDDFYEMVLRVAMDKDDPDYIDVILNRIDMDDDFITIDENFVTELIKNNKQVLAKYMLKECSLHESIERYHIDMLNNGEYDDMAKLFSNYIIL